MTIDASETGLRFAEETLGSPGVLPGSPVWLPLDPNDYGDFGGEYISEARTPINTDRQRRKGSIVDLNASASFGHDFVQSSLYSLMQGFMYADWREKQNDNPSAVTATGYTVADESGYAAGYLILAEDFGTAANNGLKNVTGTIAGEVQASGLSAEGSPPATAKITVVGVQGAAGDLDYDNAGANPAITSTALDFTTLGLIPGEWIYIGGDAAALAFATAGNNGFARIFSIAANRLEFDRTQGTPATEASTTETVQLFFGHVIKNESDPSLIKRRSYQLERAIGTPGYEYLPGSFANTLEVRVNSASKVTLQLGFLSFSSEAQAGAKSGTRPAKVQEELFNSSSDFTRLRMIDDDTAATLFTFVQEMQVTINNQASTVKAVANLGAIDVSLGDFMVGGQVTAYFASLDAVNAVKNNDDVSLDFVMVKANAGWLFDIPLITLGNARLNVVKDQPITLPISMEAVAHTTLDHTLLAQSFTYLPAAAE